MVNTKIKYLLYSNFLCFGSYAFFNPLFAIYVLHLGAKPEWIGIAWGINMYACAATILIFGKYEDKRKNKLHLVALGYLILAMGAVSYIFVTNIWQLFGAQVINAIGQGIMTPAWRTTYALSEDKGKETLEWSFVDGGAKFFIATGAIIGGFIYKYHGFKILFMMVALIQLVAVYFTLKLIKDRQGYVQTRAAN